MRFRLMYLFAVGLALANAAHPQDTNLAPPVAAGQGAGRGQRGQNDFGGGEMMAGPRGLVGTVIEVGADHYGVKNDGGEIYTVHFSANTRILKQPAQRRGEGGERSAPQALKSSDIKVGDAIAANGEVDAAMKSVGAVFVIQLDPERAKQMREMQANFAKTWLMGRVTAVDEIKITLQSPVDNTLHTFVVDENTAFRKRRDPITLADVQVGDNVRVEGSLKDRVFMATAVRVMGMPPATGGPMPRRGPPPQ